MEQPITRAEFNQLVEHVNRIERETEPMRLERRLSIPEANTLQKIMEMVGHQGPDIATLKGDVSKIETRLDHMATKGDVSALKNEMSIIEERIIDAIRKYSQPGKN